MSTNRNPITDLDGFDKGQANLARAIAQMGYTSLRKGQAEPINCIMYGRDTVCILPTGTGKCLAKDTPVMLRSGKIVPVQKVKVGDKLMGMDSETMTVLSTTQGKAKLYKVTPVKGAPFRVNEDHILTMQMTPSIKPILAPDGHTVYGEDILDISVRDYLQASKTFKQASKLIRCAANFPERPAPELDPYFVGVYLGDGVTNRDMSPGKHCSYEISNREPEVLRYMTVYARTRGWAVRVDTTRRCPKVLLRAGKTSRTDKNPRNTLLRNGCVREKHIVPAYKYGSRDVRLRLLAGLLDAAGRLWNGGYQMALRFEKLAEDIVFVARSLGLAAYTKKLCTTCSRTGKVRPIHRVYISGNVHIVPLLIPRKRAARRISPKSVLRTGFTVEQEDFETEYYGFMLNGDGRFLLGDFTVTHNSAVYALPTIAMEWKTIVFSPLIALMRDQVQSMNRAGIRTGCINSNQSDIQNFEILQEWAAGKLQMLYVAPERLSNPQFKQAMNAVTPSLCIVDEAHTISEWSFNFRPSYQLCGEFVKEYNPKVVAAFTATATDQVIDDIERVLGLSNPCICRYYPPRTNLRLSSSVLRSNDELYPAVLKKVREVSGSCIVYCPTVKEVVNITEYLSQAGESVTYYHGQITEQNLKDMNQDEFMSGRARICVATNAFGMGIDKPDIEGVIHAGPPGSIEAVTQETGRAARDGRDAICHMFTTPASLSLQEFFWMIGNPNGVDLQRIYGFLSRKSDSDANVYMTVKEIGDRTAVQCVSGAINFLQSCGCISRIENPVKLYTFRLKDGVELTPSNQKLVDLIREGGVLRGGLYKVDITWISSRLGIMETSIRQKLRQMAKDKQLEFTAPFMGKGIHLNYPPTLKHIQSADVKRAEEMRKITDVRKYVATPDEKKHQFLQDYFEVSRATE